MRLSRAVSKVAAYIVIAVIITAIVTGSAVYLAMREQIPTHTVTTTIYKTTTQTQTQTQTQTTASPTGPTVTLMVYGPWAGDEAKYFQAVINAYEKLHPNVKIKYVTMRAEDLAAAMPIQFAAHTSPADVIFTPWAWWIVKMAQKGYVEDLSNVINANEYIPSIVKKVEWDGKLWAAPFTMWLKPGFWYRKSFFEKYGLQPPKTWQDFLNLLDKLKKIPGIKNPIVSGDSTGWPLSDIVEHFIITFGGPQLQLDLISGKVKFNDPKVKEIFEKYLIPLIKNGDFSPPIEWTTAVQLWWDEKYGLYFMGTWITGMVKDPNDLAFFTLPGCKGIVGGADYAFVPKFAPHLQAALDFIKFVATKGQEIHAAQPSGKIPTWLKADPNKIWGPMKQVYMTVKEKGLEILLDLDDSVGGDWQKLFWDQLKLLWVNPDKLDQVLNTLAQQFPYKQTSS